MYNKKSWKDESFIYTFQIINISNEKNDWDTAGVLLLLLFILVIVNSSKSNNLTSFIAKNLEGWLICY